jgi:CheY-like chemotaxis protein
VRTQKIFAHLADVFGWDLKIEESVESAVGLLNRKKEVFDTVFVDHRVKKKGTLIDCDFFSQEMFEDLHVVLLCDAEKRDALMHSFEEKNLSLENFLIIPFTPLQLVKSIKGLDVDVQYLLGKDEQTAATEDARLRGVKILLVEDNLINRVVATEILKLENAQVTVAEGGQLAIDLLKKRSDFDVILMDMQMPEIDGLEATRQIRALDGLQNIPILAMTANVSPSDIRACYDAGMNAHLGKPLDIEKMVATIQQFIRKD